MRYVLALLSCLIALPLSAADPGSTAPGFSVRDTTGKTVRLEDYRGRYVVLEWNNPGCPFVRKHYASRNMQNLQKYWGAKGVAWLTINSTNRDHPDYRPPEKWQQWLTEEGAAPQSALPDPGGSIARMYQAKTTPQMFVIDPTGRLLYSGAIDDKRTARIDDVPSAHNYVAAALTEAAAGQAVSIASTAPYGCSVKY